MSKKLYQDALQLELAGLADQIVRQKARCEHAKGREQFERRLQIQRLENRRHVFEARLRNLECGPDGLWADIKADFRKIADELASGFERWIELLDDARQATRHWQ